MAPPLLLAACLLAVAQLWYWREPASWWQDAGDAVPIVRAQTVRAMTLPSVDVLLIGDSTGLMGVDPALLSSSLGGCRVENLSTMAGVGPTGYAALLEQFFARGRTAKTVILLLSQFSLELQPVPPMENRDLHLRFTWADVIHWAGVAPTAPRGAPFDGLDKIRDSIIGRVVFLPAQNPYGEYYGGSAQLMDFIMEHHGSLNDITPTGGWLPYAGGGAPSVYKIEPGWRDNAPELARVLHGFGVEHTLLTLTPRSDYFALPETLASREGALQEVAQQLGVPTENILYEPASLPNFMFSSSGHMPAPGQRYYTLSLGQVLARRHVCG